MSTMNMPRPGLGSVGSYQVSGHPFITGSVTSVGSQQKITFPRVTKKIIVQVTDQSKYVLVHFNPTGSGNVVSGKHQWRVQEHYPFTAEVKCTELYISYDGSATANYQVFAELTHIPATEMYKLTGSGLTD